MQKRSSVSRVPDPRTRTWAAIGLSAAILAAACGNGGSHRSQGDESAGAMGEAGDAAQAGATGAGTANEPHAPPLDSTVASDFSSAYRFLFEGPDAVQTGVQDGAIDDRRMAIIRGLVEDASGAPLPGAKVSSPEHPELGSTLTQSDGTFSFVVNGGGRVRVHLALDGYLSAERELTPEWRSFEPVRPIFLTKLDDHVTEVALGKQSKGGFIGGSQTSDRSGFRTASLLFGAGTSAKMVLADGSEHPIDAAHVRVTEYTAGDNGPKAMPASLPAQSGYTYAVELTVDEAEQAGATGVKFSKPVAYYVENFLKFPVGEPVPAGSYDKASGQWVPEPSGRVVSVVGVLSGRASLDVDGDGKADEGSKLTDLGIDDAELDNVGTRYSKGASLWRIPLAHFSTWDFNWCFFGGLGDALSGLFNGSLGLDDDCTASGSLIECGNQILGESIGLPGIPGGLHYRSDRVPGRREAFQFNLGLTKNPAPPKAKRVRFEMDLLGRDITYVADAAPDLKYEFEWDGLDAYGRHWQGPAPVRYRVGYVYDGWYGHTPVFGAYGEDKGWAPVPDSGVAPSAGFTPEDDLARRETTMWLGWQSTTLGAFDASQLGFGGFTLGVHHVYDPSSHTLYLGSGDRRHATSNRDAVHAIVGDVKGLKQEVGDPLGVTLSEPHGLALGPDGTVYLSDELHNRVVRLTTAGKIEAVAGTGSPGYSGDRGPATKATLDQPLGLALASDGTLYVAERGNKVVRRVLPDGTIDTFAGGGTPSQGNGDGGPAGEATFGEPHALAVAPDGALLIADAVNPAIRRVGTDGVIRTVFGTGQAGDSGDGGPGRKAQLTNPLGIAVGPDGSLYVADYEANKVRRLAPDGTASAFAGTGDSGDSGDEGPATKAKLFTPHTVDVGPDGSVYITDEGNLRVRKVTPDGIIHALAGGGTQPAAEFVPAEDAKFAQPRLVAVEHDGRLLICDYKDNLLYRLVPFLPGPNPKGYTVASSSGDSYYTFDATGRHTNTIDATTGQTLVAFGYDRSGKLRTISDANGRTTVVERDAKGQATTITSPDGLTTTFDYAASGWLAGVSNAAGNKQSYALSASGLLKNETDSAGRKHTFAFDDLGRLTKDTEASGAYQTLARSSDRSTVTRTTARGLSYVYGSNTLEDGRLKTSIALPDGRETTTVASPGRELTTRPDGTKLEVQYAADPRFGLTAKYPATTTLTTPGGRSLAFGSTRTVTLSNSEDPTTVTATQSSLSLNGAAVSTDLLDLASKTRTVTRFGQKTVYSFDAKWRLVGINAPGVAPISLSYDSNGRVIAAIQKDRITSFEYDEHGFLVKGTDPLGIATTFSPDAVGRALSVESAGASTAASYGPAGDLDGFVSSLGHQHGLTRDNGGRITGYVAPQLSSQQPSTTSYSYGPDDALESVAYPSGSTRTRILDSQGRTVAWQTPEGSTNVVYDPASGHVANLANASETITYSWDGPLLLSTELAGTVSGSIARTYDSNLRLASESVAGDTRAFSYDTYGRLTSAGTESVSYAADGARVGGTTVGNVTETFSYSPDFGELEQQSVHGGATTLYSGSFFRDARGRILQKNETLQGQTISQSFQYDGLGRLAAVTRDGKTTAYGYDAEGNRVDVDGSVNAQDQLLSSAGTAFTYDADGHLARISRGASQTTFAYDTFGRLRNVKTPEHRIEYVVDPLGRRVGKKVDGSLAQGFLFDLHGRVVAELGPSNKLVSRFVYASRSNVPDYMVKGGTTYRLVTDHLGTVRLVVNTATSAVVEAIDYDAWGRVLSDTKPAFQPFGFAGGLYDTDTQLVHFGARDYDPSIGRWTAKDPILFRGGQLNLYAYAGNDPVNHIDPSGLCVSGGSNLSPWAVAGLVGVGVLAVVVVPELVALAEAAEAVEGLEIAAEGAEIAAEGGELGEAAALPAPSGVNPWTGDILSTTANEDLTMYRVWGGESGQVGSWLSPAAPASSAEATASLALPPANAASFISEVTVPAGTRFQIGQAASAFGQPGGGIQVQLLDRISSSLFGSGLPLE